MQIYVFSLVNESIIKTVKIVHFMLFLNLVHTMKHSINLLLKFPVKLILFYFSLHAHGCFDLRLCACDISVRCVECEWVSLTIFILHPKSKGNQNQQKKVLEMKHAGGQMNKNHSPMTNSFHTVCAKNTERYFHQHLFSFIYHITVYIILEAAQNTTQEYKKLL
jgi:hypothetical protein